MSHLSYRSKKTVGHLAWQVKNFNSLTRMQFSTTKSGFNQQKMWFHPTIGSRIGDPLGWYQVWPKVGTICMFPAQRLIILTAKMDGLKHKKMTRPPIVSYRVDIYVYRKKNKQTIFDDIPKFGPTHLGVSPTWNSDYHVRFFWRPSMFGETQLGL